MKPKSDSLKKCQQASSYTDQDRMRDNTNYECQEWKRGMASCPIGSKKIME